jgi:hypothetical protein
MFAPNDSDQPRGPSEDGVSDAEESSEDGRLPALRCGGWIGFFFFGGVTTSPGMSESTPRIFWVRKSHPLSLKVNV